MRPHGLALLLAAAVLLVPATLAGCGDDSESDGPKPALDDSKGKPEVDRNGPKPAPEPEEPEPAPAPEDPTVSVRPPIVQRPIPFPEKRKQEMVAYSERHYGISDYRLRDPEVIVQHVAVASDSDSVYGFFASDQPDPELGELPGICSHFMVDSDGTIVQFVPLSIMCRHTVGLNYTSIGIEHAGYEDADVLGNPPQLRASLELTRWLRCRFGITLENVIGHNENLSSPFHMERVAELRTQTHGDFVEASMEQYRARLRALPCPGE